MPAERASTLVYNEMRSKIIAGTLSPGISLVETELAEQYGVSRNTIKKTLLQLEGENLVSIEPNKGAKVRSYSLEEVLEYLEVRSALEGLIAKLATPTISDADILAMKQCFEKMQMCLDQQQVLEYSKLNGTFHEILFHACPNRTLVNMTLDLKNRIHKYSAKATLIPGRHQQSLAEHAAILEALSAKEPERAERLVREHIANVRQVFEEHHNLLF